MSNAIKQIAHYTPPFEVQLHPSVFQCRPGQAWSEDKLLQGKTMVHHQSTTFVSGTTWKCNVCGRNIQSA